MKDPKKQYAEHKRSVEKGRIDKLGNIIEFKLSFEEWLIIWTLSGQLANRGAGKDKYCMSRFNDIGNYEVGNVFIQSFVENARQGHIGRGHSHTQAAKDKMSATHMGKVLSQETKDKIKNAVTGIKLEQVTCHCGVTGAGGAMKRWHLDNCKVTK